MKQRNGPLKPEFIIVYRRLVVQGSRITPKPLYTTNFHALFKFEFISQKLSFNHF